MTRNLQCLILLVLLYPAIAMGQADPGSAGLSFNKSIYAIGETGSLTVGIGNYSGSLATGNAVSPYDARFTIAIPRVLQVNGSLDFSGLPFVVTIASHMITSSGATMIVLALPNGIPKGVNGEFIIPVLAIKEDANILYASVTTDSNLNNPPSGNAIPNNDLVFAPVTVVQPLPLVLTSFDVEVELETAQLTWTTAEEINSDGFEIQRSRNGKDWIPIGWVEAQGGPNNVHTYYYNDRQPWPGENYYRLKMLDIDEYFAFSGVRYTSFRAVKVSVFPNPVAEIVTIDAGNLKEGVDVEIWNRAGGLNYKASGNSIYKVNVSQFESGLHFIRVYQDGQLLSQQKLMVLH